MRGSFQARLDRLAERESLLDVRPEPTIRSVVETREQAQQSRELNELFESGRAYLDTDKLPKKPAGSFFTFAEVLAAVVHLSEEELTEQIVARRFGRRPFL